MTIKLFVTVDEIAEFDDEHNTITINFLLFISWYDTRISLESNNSNESFIWYEISKLDQDMIYVPTLAIGGAETIIRKRQYGPDDKDYFWYWVPDKRQGYEY